MHESSLAACSSYLLAWGASRSWLQSTHTFPDDPIILVWQQQKIKCVSIVSGKVCACMTYPGCRSGTAPTYFRCSEPSIPPGRHSVSERAVVCPELFSAACCPSPGSHSFLSPVARISSTQDWSLLRARCYQHPASISTLPAISEITVPCSSASR